MMTLEPIIIAIRSKRRGRRVEQTLNLHLSAHSTSRVSQLMTPCNVIEISGESVCLALASKGTVFAASYSRSSDVIASYTTLIGVRYHRLQHE